MKNKPEKKKDNIKVAACYAISLPEKDLMNLIRCNAAKTIKDFCKTMKSIKKSGKVSQGIIEELNDFADTLMSISGVVDMVQQGWADMLKEYAEQTKLPSSDLKACTGKTKKAGKNYILSKGEMDDIERMREMGMTIKQIGKAIHRREKVVSDFVKSVDAKRKK